MQNLFLTAAILLLTTFKGWTQPTQYRDAVRTINAQHSMQMAQWNMQFHMNHRLGMQAANANGLINHKSNYRVVMNSGITLTVLSRMEFDEKTGRAYLALVDKSRKKDDSLRITRILPAMTHSVTQLSGANQEISQGSPADSCWLFRVLPGAVNAYSFLPHAADGLHIGYFKMLQKGDGQLVPFTETNLRNLLADDPQALALMDKQLYFEALLLYNKNSRKKTRKK